MKKLITIGALLLAQLAAIAQTDDTKYTVTLHQEPDNNDAFVLRVEAENYALYNPLAKPQAKPGQKVSVRVWLNDGYVFDQLTSADTIMTTTLVDVWGGWDYYVSSFVMPQHDVDIIVTAHFDPATPELPGLCDWDEQTGTLIVTHFTPGQFYEAVSRAVNNKFSAVRRLTVAGTLRSSDMANMGYHLAPSLNYLDLSRTDGLKELYSDDECFRGATQLQTLLLPASLETLGSYAFTDIPVLESVTCYATTPPKLSVSGSRHAFSGASPALTVYVPAESLPLYVEADGWKDMQLMPITQGVHSLTVSLPSTATGLKDMFLQLVNNKTGQSQRMVLTSRTQYTFLNLIEGTQYNTYIMNARGDVLATIKDVAIEKQDVEVAFSDLKPLRDVTLQLSVPDGAPVETDAFSVTWTDLVGNFLATGPTLAGQVEGSKAVARVKLGEQLGTQYQQPADTTIVVGEVGVVDVRLTSLAQTVLSGTVTAAATGQPIRSASIAVTQRLNGLYPVTLTTTTDAQGRWTLTAYDVPATVTAQAAGYVTAFPSPSEGGEYLAVMKDLEGTTINLDLSYRPAVRNGETADDHADYSGYQNLSFAVYDETHQQELTNIQAQGGRLILQDQQLAEGTRLRITATGGDVAPATATCTVDADGNATATLQLTQLGQLRVTFSQTDNQAVVAMLYDADGQLQGRYYYDEAKVSIAAIADGRYTLVTMGESQLFNGVNTLAALTEMRLQEGRDYVKNTVTIAAGRIDSLHNQQVPMMDETVFYYTGQNTSFTVNKATVTVGNYVTLRAQVDFKPGVTPTDASIVFDLPDGCQLVEGSVMVGNQMAQYDVDGQRLSVALSNRSDLVRFCIVPTREGNCEPSAAVSFSTDWNDIVQPLGSAGFTAEALRIDVPAQTSGRQALPVSGIAMSGAQVQVYDDEVLIGQTEANPDGSWRVMCHLNQSYNLSTHAIYATATSNGITTRTATQTVTVSQGTLTPVAYMTFNSDFGNAHETVKFDFRNATISTRSYATGVNDEIPFTFYVDFMDGDDVVNDPATVSDVVIYVQGLDNSYVEMEAKFNERQQRWVAQEVFSSSSMPVSLAVEYGQDEKIMTDRLQMDDRLEETLQTITEHQQMVKDVYAVTDEEIVLDDQALYDELAQLLAIENPDEATQKRADELIELLTGDAPQELSPVLTPDEAEKNREELDKWKYQWRDKMFGMLSYFIGTDTITLQAKEVEEQMDIPLTNGVIHYTSKRESSINEQALLSEGYTPSPMTDGSSIYYLNTGAKEAYLDSRSLMHYILEWQGGAQARKSSAGRLQSSPRRNSMTINSIFSDEEREKFRNIFLQLRNLEENSSSQTPYALAQVFLGQGRTLSRELYMSANNLYMDGLKNMKQQVENVYKEIIDSCNVMIQNASEERAMAKNKLKQSVLPEERGYYLNLMGYAKRDSIRYEKSKKEAAKKKRKLDGLLNGMPRSLGTTSLSRGDTDLAFMYEETPYGLLYILRLCFYYARNTYEDLGEWQKTYQAIRNKIPCEGNEDEAIAIMTEVVDAIANNGREETKEEFYHAAKFEYSNVNGVNDYAPQGDADMTLPLSWFYENNTNRDNWTHGSFWTCSVLMSSHHSNWEKEQFIKSKNQRKGLDARIKALKCKKPDDDQNITHNSSGQGFWDWLFGTPKSPRRGGGGRKVQANNTMQIVPFIDPSGYVYEAVSSNRLEGVRATCYYKETGEDMYGDMYEREVVWNAEEYAQENPQFTDSEGKYHWDVPQGLWQVRYEKDGYEPKRSEWLPVPPPQLEVNVGMTQLRQPSVQKVKAYTDGIEITFDKYMRPATLSTDNIFVTVGGQTIGGTIELLNADSGYETPDSVYASKIRFIPNLPSLGEGSGVGLTVRKTVESYAGLQMEQDFQQEFDVEQRITAIVTDTLLYMAEGSERTVTVSILPAEAAKGKQLKVSGADDGIVSHKEGELTLDASGQATVVLTANSLGSSAVRFCLTDDPDLAATTLVTVRDAALMYVYAPRSSRMSGTEIYRGAEIRLTCQTAGATILYTLDGSCPCDAQNANVMTYTGPITATGEELTIRAMAVANGMAESDVVKFRYKVIDNPVSVEPILLSPFTLHPSPTEYYRLDGRRTSALQKGLNIVRQEDGTVNKILVK